VAHFAVRNDKFSGAARIEANPGAAALPLAQDGRSAAATENVWWFHCAKARSAIRDV
jgi:hypothetical protein